VVKALSKGAYGRVFLARQRRTGDYYALKILDKSEMIEKNQVHQRAIAVIERDRSVVQGSRPANWLFRRCRQGHQRAQRTPDLVIAR